MTRLEPMYEANELLADTFALRKRMQLDGYLFLRNIVPTEALRVLRDQVTAILADIGWIAHGAERIRARAVASPCREGEPRYFEAMDRIVKLEAFHCLAHEPALLNVMRQVLGDTAFPHPLAIARLVFPQSPELATPPHQDYPNNQGTPELTAAWVPLGDCSVADGSLAILEGSHRFGVLPLHFHLGPGNRRAVLRSEMASCRWVGADFKVGDIVLFPSLTVHRAMENLNPDCMRLSVDFRYQQEGEALTPGSLLPHFNRYTWEEIYQGWRSTRYQYYWLEKQYLEVPWNPALHDLPEGHLKEALKQELAFERLVKKRREAAGAGTDHSNPDAHS